MLGFIQREGWREEKERGRERRREIEVGKDSLILSSGDYKGKMLMGENEKIS